MLVRILLLVLLAAGCGTRHLDPIRAAEDAGAVDDGGLARTHLYVAPQGDDTSDGMAPERPLATLQRALDLAGPGSVVHLAPGEYRQDARTRRHGLPAGPIAIVGPADAILRGGGAVRVFEINHDHIRLEGFTIDGLHGDPTSRAGYRDKLIYAAGTTPLEGVNGLEVLRMNLRNAGGECVRLRYFARDNEIGRSTIGPCGVYDFQLGGGGRNGEGVYVGTSPSDRDDGKNPTADPDLSTDNWIHDNDINTAGNDCVDIKEDAARNSIEGNRCRGQRHADSAGLSVRSDDNVVRNNTVTDGAGYGIRVGAERDRIGVRNQVTGNQIHRHARAALHVVAAPQGSICGNVMTENVEGDAAGGASDGVLPAAPCP